MPAGTTHAPFAAIGQQANTTAQALVMVAKDFSADQCGRAKATVAATIENV